MSRRRDRIESVHTVAVVGLLAIGLVATPAAAQDWPTLSSFAGPNCFTAMWEGELVVDARITASRQPLQITFGTGDSVFLQGEGAAALEAGTVHRIMRIEDGEWVVAGGGSSLGRVISFVGELTVLSVDDERALGQIGLACQGIELGDFVGPPVEAPLPEVITLEPFDGRRLITPVEEDATVLFGAFDTLMGDTIETDRQQTSPR